MTNPALPSHIAITGIHTDIGKTVVSAVLAHALDYDYWKPVQAGSLDHSDTQYVQHLSPFTRTFAEAYRLQLAASPHTAADAQGISLSLDDYALPPSSKLIIETAGGVCSPITQQHVVADFVRHYHLPTILVIRNYLGCISHTIASIDALLTRNITILGIIINGAFDDSTTRFIRQYSDLPVLAHLDELSPLSSTRFEIASATVRAQLESHFRL